MRGEVVGCDRLVEILGGGVIEDDAVLVDDQAAGGGVAVIAVGDDVGDGLAEDAFAQADAHVAFEVEGVVEVFHFSFAKAAVRDRGNTGK